MEVKMKLSIFEKNTIDETEVVVNCKQKNHEIEKLAKEVKTLIKSHRRFCVKCFIVNNFC